jgi:serine kinase of HPr protein (carbohydrate metabolism regulator)
LYACRRCDDRACGIHSRAGGNEVSDFSDIAEITDFHMRGEARMTAKTVHASAVLIGAGAVLIRGPSGSGKSQLALGLIEAARSGALAFARLVADDRVHLEAANGRLLASPAAALAGLIEVRGVGLMRLAYEQCAVVSMVVDLAAADALRLPQATQRRIEIDGINLPRLAVASGVAVLPAVLALINSEPDSWI